MQKANRIPITVLCGFLGSGKTTLLRRWQVDKVLQDAAYIIHDLSEFGVDAELLSDENSIPKVGQLVNRVAALHGIHAREKLQASVAQALDEIAALDPLPPHVLCESTGAARPWPLIAALTQNKRCSLRHFIVTVDALNLHRDFHDGRVLTGEARMSEDVALQHAAGILAEQILFASVIILTKVDTVSQAVVDAQVGVLRKLQPHATIGLSSHAGLHLSQLDATPAPKPEILKKLAEQFGLTVERPTADEVKSVVFHDQRPFHPQRLYEVCQQQLGTGIYRTKGFMWLASRPSDVLLWQQSGSQISFEIISVWGAEIAGNRYGNLLPEELELVQQKLESAHPVFGDRRNTLTIIGLPSACATFAAALQTALCTEQEIVAWQSGEVFSDPWPKTVRHIK